MNRFKSGVTLIELLTVIVIIMILIALLSPVLSAARNSAREKRAKTEMADLSKAWTSYWQTYSNWPSGSKMTGLLVRHLNGTDPANKFSIKFMDFPNKALVEGFKDPWGSLYKVDFSEKKLNKKWYYETRVYFRNRDRYRYE